MPLVTTTEMFKKAYDNGYAIGAFNVNNMEIVQGITSACKKLNAPVILQVSSGARKYAHHDYLVKMVEAAVAETGLPIALHLDHGPDFETCKSCIDGGFTSVMIDGSSKPYEENVELTREVVKYAHARGVSVEGELGVLAGVEDHVFAANSTYTNPLSAIEFFKKTGVDALAISYGTMHGASKGKDVKLRKEIPIAIKECMNHEGIQGALVSHGSSTVPRYIVEEINALGGNIQNAYGISKEELKAGIMMKEKIEVEQVKLQEQQVQDIQDIANVFSVQYNANVLQVKYTEGKRNLANLLDYFTQEKITYGKVNSQQTT